jgi:anti-sigma regulatory factor (Ser/Thr protein kinase)
MYTPDINHARPQLTSGMTLAAVPTAVRLARLFVCRQLSQWGLSQLISDAELVTSELVTNAVNATGTTNPRPRWSELHDLALITVRLVVTVDSLIIEVWDRDPSPPVPQQPEQADEAGRGLLIVGALCRRWHYFFPESGGKAVWGELVILAHDLLPSGLPKRQQPRRTPAYQAEYVSSYATLERVLEGLRRI